MAADADRPIAPALASALAPPARAALDALAHAVLLIDDDGRVGWSNRRADLVFGPLVGTPVVAIALDEDASALDQLVARRTPGVAEVRELRLRTESGDPRAFEISATRAESGLGVDAVLLEAHDVAGRRSALDAMRAASARFGALLAHVEGGLLVIDHDRTIAFANDEFARQFGVAATAHAIVGRPADVVLGEAMHAVADPIEFASRIAAIYERGERCRDDEVPMADGRVLARSYTPVTIGAESFGHLWLYRDTTDQVRRAQALADALDAAVAGARLKDEFVATVSHELRTPLQAVVGTAELLAGAVDGEAAELVEVLRRSVTHLGAIVDDVLDFEKIEAEELVVEHRPVDVRRLVADVVDAFRAAADGDGTELVARVASVVPVGARTDPVRVRQVLSNLLSNALKFARGASVTVLVDVAPAADGELLEVAVVDTGVGIAETEIERIFEPFAQAGAGRAAGGTGLGLAICRRLAGLLGGTLAVCSAPGEGATFTLRVPLEPVALPAGRSTVDSPAAARGGRVLLADDDPTVRLIVTRLLERLGYEVRSVTNGVEMLTVAPPVGRWAAVLVDGQMPGMDGPTAVAAWREHELERGVARTPIVALTAGTHRAVRTAFVDAGADAFLAKPVTSERLAATLADLLGGPDAPDAPDTPEGPDASARRGDVRGATNVALERLVDDFGDRVVAVGAVQTYLGLLDTRLRRIDGAASDDDDRRRAAHELKGAAAMLGATASAAAAARVESARSAGEVGAAVAELVAAARADADQLAAWCAGSETNR